MTQPLDIRAQYQGARLIVIGGTGFLGKVWLSMVLSRFPDIDHIWLLVRARKNADGSIRQSSEERFWAEIAPSGAMDPLRAAHPGSAFETFMRSKITPIDGDVSAPFGGVSPELRDALRGNLTAVVNVAGIVDFTPPLDYALKANAFGMRNLVDLVRDLDEPPFMHTSTCYVAGDRTGQVDEVHPLEFPFPKADQLDLSHWDPENEISECVDLVDNVRHRANDAFRQSWFLDQAKHNLEEKGEPARGSALDDELRKVKNRYTKDRLVDVGMERAKYWGWHNTYTYTKSIGEQILAGSGLTFTIARPAVVESAVAYPKQGWNEGINTSSPLIYLGIYTPGRFTARKDSVLDIIPVDMVAAGMVLALGELIEGTHQPVYQLGTSDSNGCKMYRLIELVGLYRRKHWQKHASNPLEAFVRSRLEPTPFTEVEYEKQGPKVWSKRFTTASDVLKKYAPAPMRPLTSPLAASLKSAAGGLKFKGYVQDQFIPFTATHSYRFQSDNARAAHARLDEEMQALIPWNPETIEWRHYLLEVHIPGLVENVFPQLDEKMKRDKKPLRGFDTLIDLVEEGADRHGYVTALMRTEPDGLARVTYIDLRDRAKATGTRLQAAGVLKGEHVVVSGKNHPDWAIAFFGVLYAGAIPVPVDPAMDAASFGVIRGKAEITHVIADSHATEHIADGLEHCTVHNLHDITADGSFEALVTHDSSPDDVASLLFTSGTTGEPKGVMLTHRNFTWLTGSMATVFPLRSTDRLLSVLPLHHTFEFTCGLLLPLSRGCRIVYLDAIDGERLAYGLEEGRITAMVGVPALWQLLERRIRSQVKERGRLAEVVFKQGMGINRSLARASGLDLGKLMFGTVHNRLGGNIRVLISGGAALPRDTMELFAGVGLPLSEGYGLTEAAPVIAAVPPRPGQKPGSVGKPLPGITVKIADPDDNGVGEVLAKGPNVMKGYYKNAEATAQAITADGFLRTGDLGKLDHSGRLTLMGRAKDVVVTASGENIYLDDVENRLGNIPGVEELSLVGLPDSRGGERLGLLAVPDGEGDKAHHKATTELRRKVDELPAFQRPSVIHLVDAPLPRTATRKIQRKEVRRVLERIAAATEASRPKKGVVRSPVLSAVAAVAGVDTDKVNLHTRLADDLAFDSLMSVELSSTLGAIDGSSPDPDAILACETVADLIQLTETTTELAEEEAATSDDRIRIPEFLRDPAKEVMRQVQLGFYNQLLDTKVTGRAFIPANRQVIVVANHTSHLDMGLVKFALGPYGKQLTAFAAKDYFFEGNKWWVAYFELLTNLAAIDRKAGFRTSLEQAKQVVEEGHISLIFPEGTRNTDGQMTEFKPLIGKLSLETGVDILPMYLDGTYDVLPKGSAIPRGRTVRVRIGPPLCIADLERLTAEVAGGKKARAVALIAETAVRRLRDNDVLDLAQCSTLAEATGVEQESITIQGAFDSLPTRFAADRAEKPLTWYFSLGEVRYTVSIHPDGSCSVVPGRPTGSADCVVKTSEEMMRRIIAEKYVPGPPEFMSGVIKTNEIPLLIEFSRIFQLQETAP